MENDEYEENCEPSPELLRLVEQEREKLNRTKKKWKWLIWKMRGKKRMLKLKLV